MSQESQCNFQFLDWDGQGYFAVPKLKEVQFPASPVKTPWTAWMAAFLQATRGNFKFVGRLAELGGQVDGLVDKVCGELLGDACPDAVFPLLLERARLNDNCELTYEWCKAIATRGRLGDVPALLDAYEANITDIDDNPDIILIYIDDMLVSDECSLPDPAASGGVSGYRRAVEERCTQLLDRIGSEDVHLWRGEPTSVKRMAETLLALNPNRILPTHARRRFEASTGVNCKQMFAKNSKFLPLAAAAIAEDFLRSDGVDRYIEGSRYFFGHQVP